MFKPIFSLAFVLLWGAISLIVFGAIWWGTRQLPDPLFTFVVGVMAGMAAKSLEADLARRQARRGRPPHNHRKTTA